MLQGCLTALLPSGRVRSGLLFRDDIGPWYSERSMPDRAEHPVVVAGGEGCREGSTSNSWCASWRDRGRCEEGFQDVGKKVSKLFVSGVLEDWESYERFLTLLVLLQAAVPAVKSQLCLCRDFCSRSHALYVVAAPSGPRPCICLIPICP